MLNRTTAGYIHIYEYTRRKYAQRKYTQSKYTQRKYTQRKYTQRKYVQRKYAQRKYTQREYAQIRLRMKNSMELLCNYDIINVTVINNQ